MAPPWFALPRRTTTLLQLWWNPADYERTVEAAKNGGFSLDERRRLAAGAFAHTAAYDTAVATWTASQFLQDEDANFWPPYAGLGFERSETLRTARTRTSVPPCTLTPPLPPVLLRRSSCTVRR